MNSKQLIAAAFDKALYIQAPLAQENVARLRRVHPNASPEQVIAKLGTAYLTAVTASGGASGATAIVPGWGVPAALGEAMLYTEATILYVLSRAEVHGLHPEDIERRRLLTYMVLVGDSAQGALGRAIPRTGGHMAKNIVKNIPMTYINGANKILGPRFITKYGTKQGILVLSKQVPLGVGAVLGAGGNHVFGRLTVKTADRVFGPGPSSW